MIGTEWRVRIDVRQSQLALGKALRSDSETWNGIQKLQVFLILFQLLISSLKST